MGRLYGIVLVFAVLLAPWARAQTLDCEQTIALATEEFNAGHFYAVPSILSQCINSFNRDQRQRAHLLLTQTYLLLDDPIGAKNSYLEVLAANPEFVPDEQLHAIDLVYLSKRFTATPKFSWFVSAGSNVSPMRLIRDLYTAKGTTRYSLRPGYHFGGGGEYSYDDHIRLRVEVNYMYTSYKSEVSNYFKPEEASIADIKTFTDRQNWISLPVYVCYSDNVGIYRPYAFAGYAFSRLLGDRASIRSQNITTDDETKEPSSVEDTSPDLNFSNRRNKLNQSLLFGGGVKYKIGLDFVFAELRYNIGLKNIVNPDNRLVPYTDDQTSAEVVGDMSPLFEYGHTDDFVRMDNLVVTFGFVRPLYKPRELRHVRTRGVLRKMKK